MLTKIKYKTKCFALVSLALLITVTLPLGIVSATAPHANSAYSKTAKPTLPRQVTLIEQGRSINITPAQLGWQLDTERITTASRHTGLSLDMSLKIAGKQLNPLANKNLFGKHDVPAYTKVNRKLLTRAVTNIADTTQQAPVDAKIITQNGDYAISPSATGQRIDVNKAVKMVKSALSIRRTTVNLPMVELKPTTTEASLQPKLQQLKAQRAAALAAAKATAAKPVISGPCAANPAGRRLILVSISQQHLWACYGSSQVYNTAITSGAYLAGTATPTGTWHIYSKSRDIHLTGPGYDYPVSYWMAFYADYGFHDSNWQAFPYGSAAYASQGSHGCIHVPASAMAWLYGWAPIGTTVTING